MGRRVTVDRLVFTGDGFRSVAGEASQIQNVRWLEEHLGHLLRNLTGLSSTVSLPIVGHDVAEFVRLQDGQLGLDGWAKLFWSEPAAKLSAAIADACRDALMITFEMPPVMQAALDQAGIPWIDVGICPLRFLPDWALHLRTSTHFDVSGVQSLLLTPEDVAGAVQHVLSWYGPAPVSEPTLVFFAQTARDRTMIRDGRFCESADVVEVLDAARCGRPVLVKPHPWEPDNVIVSELVARGAQITDAETYALLANPMIEVLTFSSSVGREACAFERAATTINSKVQNWAYSGIDVLRHARSPELWSTILSSAGIPTHAAPAVEWRPNGLRETIGGQGLSLSVWRDRTVATPFYDRSVAERIVMTEKAISTRTTVIDRWAALANTEASAWDERSALAAEWLVDEAGIVDMGCGTMNLSRHLAPGQKYVPVDIVSRDARTLVCDFNREPPPTIDVPAVACLGLLEYLHEPAQFLAALAQTHQVAVVSYCVTDAPAPLEPRRGHAWVNDFDAAGVEALFKNSGWQVMDRRLVGDFQLLWRLARPAKELKA